MNLGDPFKKLNLKNRAVMAPMTRCGCDSNGIPTSDLFNYYLDRSKKSIGLIIIESAAINSNSALGYQNGLQFFSQEHVDAWKPVIKEMKNNGAKVWIQLYHAGRLTVKEISKESPIAPSSLAPFDGASYWRPEVDGEILNFQTKTPYRKPAEISLPQIQTVINEFAESCKLAQEAGFDGVELHGAHGYLIHQFLHAETNIREDLYNSKSYKFVEDLIKACRKAVPSSFTLCFRLSQHMVDDSFVKFNLEQLDFSKIVKLLDEIGVDVFHSSELKAGSKVFKGDKALCEMIRENTSKPIIVCGRISKQKTIDKLLGGKNADLVAFGRSLITNPDLVKNLLSEESFELEKFDYEKHLFPIV